MEPTPELIDALYRERVLRARATPPEEKMLDSARLFDMACEITKGGIRQQHPDWAEQQVLGELRRRLAIRRILENSP
jgi:hypothetical protein